MSNLSDAEFKTLIIRMHKELSEYLNGMKKIQVGMLYTNGNKEQSIENQQ